MQAKVVVLLIGMHVSLSDLESVDRCTTESVVRDWCSARPTVTEHHCALVSPDYAAC